jgi:hypothetical protein
MWSIKLLKMEAAGSVVDGSERRTCCNPSISRWNNDARSNLGAAKAYESNREAARFSAIFFSDSRRSRVLLRLGVSVPSAIA